MTHPAAGTTAPAQPTTQQPQQPTSQTNAVPNTGTTTGTTTNPAVPVFVAPTTGSENGAPAGAQEQAGFPQNTPWRDMKPEEQVAYWQHQARRHEDRVKSMADYDQLKQVEAEYQRIREANQTEQE